MYHFFIRKTLRMCAVRFLSLETLVTFYNQEQSKHCHSSREDQLEPVAPCCLCSGDHNDLVLDGDNQAAQVAASMNTMGT